MQLSRRVLPLLRSNQQQLWCWFLPMLNVHPGRRIGSGWPFVVLTLAAAALLSAAVLAVAMEGDRGVALMVGFVAIGISAAASTSASP